MAVLLRVRFLEVGDLAQPPLHGALDSVLGHGTPVEQRLEPGRLRDVEDSGLVLAFKLTHRQVHSVANLGVLRNCRLHGHLPVARRHVAWLLGLADGLLRLDVESLTGANASGDSQAIVLKH